MWFEMVLDQVNILDLNLAFIHLLSLLWKIYKWYIREIILGCTEWVDNNEL